MGGAGSSGLNVMGVLGLSVRTNARHEQAPRGRLSRQTWERQTHMSLERFGVGMDAGLLAAFDQLLDRQGYPNRSEAIRDLVRASLAADALADANQPAFGVVVVMYDHHKPDLVDQLISIQHDAAIEVVCSTHVHIDACNCAEAIFAVGTAGEIRDLGRRLAALKGVARGESIVLARPGDSE